MIKSKKDKINHVMARRSGMTEKVIIFGKAG